MVGCYAVVIGRSPVNTSCTCVCVMNQVYLFCRTRHGSYLGCRSSLPHHQCLSDAARWILFTGKRRSPDVPPAKAFWTCLRSLRDWNPFRGGIVPGDAVSSVFGRALRQFVCRRVPFPPRWPGTHRGVGEPSRSYSRLQSSIVPAAKRWPEPVWSDWARI